MKLSIILPSVLLLHSAKAHFTFSHLLINNTQSSVWQYVRDVTLSSGYGPYYPNDPEWNKTFPQYDLTSPDIRCGRSAYKPSPKTLTADIVAGSPIGFRIAQNWPWHDGTGAYIQHPGPGQVYLAKVPEGIRVEEWDGDGQWFKVAYGGPVSDTKWLLQRGTDFNFTLPHTTPPGTYLMRMEMIYPNVLPDELGTQFYVNCAHVNIIGPGGGTPKGFVKFPGAYTKDTPGVKMDEFSFGPPLNRNLSNYPMPGPAVWTG